jgi:hypothetical protein
MRALPIVDCRLPICVLLNELLRTQRKNRRAQIGNWQSAIRKGKVYRNDNPTS